MSYVQKVTEGGTNYNDPQLGKWEGLVNSLSFNQQEKCVCAATRTLAAEAQL